MVINVEFLKNVLNVFRKAAATGKEPNLSVLAGFVLRVHCEMYTVLGVRNKTGN